MKRRFLFFVLLAMVFLMPVSSNQPPSIRIRKVVIDAGHGGDDPGAVGKKSKEKDIALSIALKLGNYIKTNFPETEVIYTRKTDVFVELYRRAKIANDHQADLFISIHCNSSTKPEPQGTETWVMGIHKSQANLEVAKKENASVLFEEDYTNQYDGFDPNSPEANIIFSLYQNAFLDQSLKFAGKIQKQFTTRLGRADRGVKQAGFLVLYKTYMPAVLIEAGFISNPAEEEFMMSDNGQTLLASAIYRAFKEYKRSVEGVVDMSDTLDVLVNPVIPADTLPGLPVRDSVKTKTGQKEIFFRVQFATSSTRKNTSAPEFKGIRDVRVYFHNGLYKYTAGNEAGMEAAVALLHDMQAKGFKDAFVVAFLNEERISPEEAIKLLKK